MEQRAPPPNEIAVRRHRIDHAVMQLITCPFAHTRLEHLDENGFPTVSIHLLETGPLLEWDRFKQEHTLEIGCQRKYARAIGLLIDFRVALGDTYAAVDMRASFFKGFAEALVRGTTAGGDDPSGLFWLPRARTNNVRILAYVTKFTDWVAAGNEGKPLNGTRQATVGEWITFWQAWRIQRSRSLLGHMKSSERSRARANVGRTVAVRGRTLVAEAEPVHAFPESGFVDLIEIGFLRRKKLTWTTLRDILIALLLHEGGLRLCEALHLWMGDVFEHPESPTAAVVRVFHPRDGKRDYRDPATGVTKQITAAEYLMLVYGRVPLTDLPGSKAVGWKGPALHDAGQGYMHVFWRSDDSAKLFLILYLRYVQLRPLVRHHPYLFIATGGEPLTVGAYEKVHGAAVRRIGLVARKTNGTTPHGHRHAYGKWLAAGGAGRKVIKVAMHHKSPFSQEVYTAKDAAETARDIRSLLNVRAPPLSASIPMPSTYAVSAVLRRRRRPPQPDPGVGSAGASVTDPPAATSGPQPSPQRRK